MPSEGVSDFKVVGKWPSSSNELDLDDEHSSVPDDEHIIHAKLWTHKEFEAGDNRRHLRRLQHCHSVGRLHDHLGRTRRPDAVAIDDSGVL